MGQSERDRFQKSYQLVVVNICQDVLSDMSEMKSP